MLSLIQMFYHGTHTYIRHIGNFFNSCLDITVDSNRTCYHFTYYFSQLMSNFRLLIPDNVVNFIKSYCYIQLTNFIFDNNLF